MNLFDIYPDIAAMLFNPALASCWEHLSESFQVRYSYAQSTIAYDS